MKPITEQRELHRIMDTVKRKYGGDALVEYENRCAIMRTSPRREEVLRMITEHLTRDMGNVCE